MRMLQDLLIKGGSEMGKIIAISLMASKDMV